MTKRGQQRPALPDELLADVNHILHPRRVTEDLGRELADALDDYPGRTHAAASQAKEHQRIDAVQRLITAATTLQREIRRADAAFQLKGRWFLPSTWAPLGPELQLVIDGLNGWLSLRSTGPRRRGNPHNGQSGFRVRVLGALQDAGLRITNPSGQAARVLARLLQEIDRRDGILPRERSDFSGKQWARWVDEVRFVDAAIADQKRSGLTIFEWARRRASATRKAKTRKGS